MTVKPNPKGAGGKDIDVTTKNVGQPGLINVEETLKEKIEKLLDAHEVCWAYMFDDDTNLQPIFPDALEALVSQVIAKLNEHHAMELAAVKSNQAQAITVARAEEREKIKMVLPYKYHDKINSLSVQDTECQCCCHGVDDPDCQYNDCIHCSKQGEDDNGKK